MSDYVIELVIKSIIGFIAGYVITTIIIRVRKRIIQKKNEQEEFNEFRQVWDTQRLKDLDDLHIRYNSTFLTPNEAREILLGTPKSEPDGHRKCEKCNHALILHNNWCEEKGCTCLKM